MTEAEWLTCTEPMLMLDFVRGGVCDRKLRLFACACTRRVWETAWKLGRYEPDRATVEAVEQLAESPTESTKLATIRGGASLELELLACEYAIGAAWWATEELPMAMPDWQDEMPLQAELLRDIFANPFHTIAIEQSWLTWQDRCIGKIAQSIYDERAFERLPILADTLKEAGCTDTAILDHLRGPGPHVRGCWVVDLLLGKE